MKYADVVAALSRIKALADGIAKGTLTGPESLPLYSTTADNYVGRAARTIERESLAVKAWLNEQTVIEVNTTNASGFLFAFPPTQCPPGDPP